MSINLKNAEAEALLKRLSELTGEGLTRAATEAFRERLERLEAERRARQRRALDSLNDLIAEARRSPPAAEPSSKSITDELWGGE